MFAGSVMTQTLPQGSTKYEHQRSKEASSHQGSASLEPVLPRDGGPPTECPEGLASQRQQRPGHAPLPVPLPPPRPPSTAEEQSLLGRHIWVKSWPCPRLLCDLRQVAGPPRTHIHQRMDPHGARLGLPFCLAVSFPSIRLFQTAQRPPLPQSASSLQESQLLRAWGVGGHCLPSGAGFQAGAGLRRNG